MKPFYVNVTYVETLCVLADSAKEACEIGKECANLFDAEIEEVAACDHEADFIELEKRWYTSKGALTGKEAAALLATKADA